MTALEIIRLVGTEFIAIDDYTVEQWIEIVRPMVSKKQFGKLYEQALAFLVCHRMKMVGVGQAPAEGLMGMVSGGSGGMSVASVSDGGTSISFNSGAGAWTFSDAELSLTTYGVQYLQLRHMCIVPIHIRGGMDCGI